MRLGYISRSKFPIGEPKFSGASEGRLMANRRHAVGGVARPEEEMAAKKKASSWGGARSGAGRPIGSGPGPSPNARVNRIAVMLSNSELAKLERIASRKKIPVATLAYQLLMNGLRKAR